MTPDRLVETREIVAPVRDELDVREDGDTESDLLPIEEGDALADHALFLEPAHPAPAGRDREIHPFRELCRREGAVLLQRLEDAQVRTIERRLGQPLFIRSWRSLALTDLGKMVLPLLESGFGTIFNAIEILQEARRPNPTHAGRS